MAVPRSVCMFLIVWNSHSHIADMIRVKEIQEYSVENHKCG